MKIESLKSITEQILQEAKESAEAILKDAQEYLNRKLEEQRQLGINKANEEARYLLKKAEAEAETDRLRKIAEAKIKANWIILSQKEQIINTVLSEVKKRLKILTKSKEYIFILEKLILEAGIILGGGELEVQLNAQDSTLPLDFNRMALNIGERTGVETKLRLSEEKIEVIGGAIVKAANGKFLMDNTFDDIINRQERNFRIKIAKFLFGHDE